MLGDCPLPWSVALPGGDILETIAGPLALERGGHLRVGLEDYAGPDQPTNLEIIERTVKLCHKVGRGVATPAEAAAMMRVGR
jgi:3-keto-5-aminohexanoate cleavage enzyme